MTKLTDAAKKAIGEIRPSLVATASGAGKPNVSAKGSLRAVGLNIRQISTSGQKNPIVFGGKRQWRIPCT